MPGLRNTRNTLTAFVIFILIGNAILAFTPSASAFSWGGINARTDYSGVYSIGQYDAGTVNLTLSYDPYFFAFLPIWVDIKISGKPSWLEVITDQRTSALKPRENKVVKITFQMDNYNVKAGITGNIAINITGEVLKGTRFLQIDPTSAYIQVRYDPSLPPTVNITFPADGTEVKNTVVIMGNASDADGDRIQKVEINLGDGNWITANGTESWSYSWNTSGLLNRNYVIQARSYDGSEYSRIDSITVRVNNEEEDNDTSGSTPGFEMILLFGAVALAMLVKKRK